MSKNVVASSTVFILLALASTSVVAATLTRDGGISDRVDLAHYTAHPSPFCGKGSWEGYEKDFANHICYPCPSTPQTSDMGNVNFQCGLAP